MPTQHHPQPGPTACSVSSARLGEPLAGTGPVAAAWLAIEQPGPWGGRALTESHLDRDLGRELGRRAEAAGVRIAMIRRPGRHALAQSETDPDPDQDEAAQDSSGLAEQAEPGQPRQVLLANTIPGRAALRSMTITDPQQLLELDLVALAAGEWTGGAPQSKPVLLVCTNGKRDKCCALLGRALALDLAQVIADTAVTTHPGGFDIWESDHLGGHRLAPTAVVLPTGFVYGRLDVATGLAAAEAAQTGLMVTQQCRGRSTWNRRGQAADLALREELQQFAADAVLVTGEHQTGAGEWIVELTVRGTGYRASVTEREAAEPRPESCGKAPGTPIELSVTALEKLAQQP
jgi:Sucrase/ferredoxin-like